MKKTENEPYSKNSKFRKVTDFISKYSVYGVFGLMLIAVVLLTVLSLPSKNGKAENSPAPTKTVDKIPENTPSASPKATVRPTLRPSPSDEPKPTETLPTEPSPTPSGNDETDVKKEINTDFRISLPFDRKKIITKYSSETPVYSETLDEWSCHVGIDFECDAGQNVPSAANGIVKSVTEDDLYGKSVLIEHQDGFSTLYRGLDNVSVKAEELVAKGQPIGTSLQNIPFEAHLPSHIHFEVIKNGIRVDPMSFEE